MLGGVEEGELRVKYVLKKEKLAVRPFKTALKFLHE
jgi:hypothetical protein